ncbi:CCA tRNA nucleotidyltransferase [Candidatus Micrarchaeota archaeon]|nr:CCA tRNA nucleotidyltransferase [Candidatus Micrarchaeota archaeon]
METANALEKIAQAVAKKVSPTPQQAAAEKIFAQKLMATLSKALPQAKLHLVGSTARDTGLQGDKDLDVFAAFPRELEEEVIVQKTVAACKKTLPKAGWVMHYAEHPYLQGRIDGYSVEVIPCFKTDKGQKIKSAVDRTPLHMDFLQKQLTQAQRQDVRALKRLLKTHHSYGAELRIRGFSGLLCEYLILNYRSFSGLIDAARLWRPPVRIDMTKATDQGQTAVATFDTPLVLIDAVDESRNVAAVVSSTQVHRFISLCQILWRQPGEKLFFPQKQKTTSAAQLQKILKTRGTDWLVLQMKKPDVVEDILWPQLERSAHSLEKQLKMREFTVLNAHAFDDGDNGPAGKAMGNNGISGSKRKNGQGKNAFIFLELQSARLPPIRKTQGPSITHEAQVRQFVAGKKPLRGPFVEGERVWVEEKRVITDAFALIKQFQKQPERYGIGSYLIKPFKSARRFDRVEKLKKYAVQALARFLRGKERWL